MRALAFFLALILLLPVSAADLLLPSTLQTHYVGLTTVPTSPTDVYTSNVWLLAIELIPQSTSSPTCTVQDKAGTPNVAYNSISLTPNHSYRDERRIPLFMSGGVTWSCSDTTVKAQLVVQY